MEGGKESADLENPRNISTFRKPMMEVGASMKKVGNFPVQLRTLRPTCCEL